MTGTLIKGAATGSGPDAVPAACSRGRGVQLAALVSCQVALLAWLTRGSWFFVDDFLFLAQAREERFSVDFLRLPLFEHFSPVHRLFDFAFVRAFGLNWPAARVVLLLLVAACIFAFYATARALLGSDRSVLALTGLYGTSLFFVRNSTWWTGGVHLFALTLFSLLTCLGYIRWYRDRERRWLTLSVASYAGALLSHEQAMLVPAYLGLATIFLLAPRPTLRAVLREWRTWLIYGAMTAVALLNYLATYYQELGRPSLDEFGQFLGVSIFEGVLPTFLGLKVPEATLVSQRFTMVLAAFVAGALIIASLRRSRHAWQAWTFLVVSVLVAIVPLGLGRIVLLGVEVGREPRYQTAVAFLVLLALGAAFDPRYAPVRPASTRQARRWPGSHPALTGALVALYLVLHVRGATRVHDSLWEPAGPKQFFSTFADQSRPIKAAEGQIHVFPGTVSESVMPLWLSPFNRFEHALVLADPAVRVGMRREAFVVGADGHLTRAAFRPEPSPRPANTAYRLEQMNLDEARADGALCATTEGSGQLRIPVPPSPAEAVYAAASFEAAATRVGVFAEGGDGNFELLQPTRPLPRLVERFWELPAGPIHALVFTVAGPGSICVRSAEIGALSSE